MFAKKKLVKKSLLRPEILTHPNIPKPLHGLNPRNILGKVWWDNTRFKAQQKYDYKCACCGVPKQEAKKHQWLEGHEYFKSHDNGIWEVIEIVPLCHYCHNFIHSGRLFSLFEKDVISLKEIKEVLSHGFSILSKNNLKCFSGTFAVAEHIGIDTLKVLPDNRKLPLLSWNDYKLKLDGVLYDSNFDSYEDWYEHYS